MYLVIDSQTKFVLSNHLSVFDVHQFYPDNKMIVSVAPDGEPLEDVKVVPVKIIPANRQTLAKELAQRCEAAQEEITGSGGRINKKMGYLDKAVAAQSLIDGSMDQKDVENYLSHPWAVKNGITSPVQLGHAFKGMSSLVRQFHTKIDAYELSVLDEFSDNPEKNLSLAQIQSGLDEIIFEHKKAVESMQNKLLSV